KLLPVDYTHSDEISSHIKSILHELFKEEIILSIHEVIIHKDNQIHYRDDFFEKLPVYILELCFRKNIIPDNDEFKVLANAHSNLMHAINTKDWQEVRRLFSVYDAKSLNYSHNDETALTSA